jgi:carbon monoxide dehydrogenase subunit G
MADRTNSNITINAAKADVMTVIADLEAYPEWAEGLREVTVLEDGADGRPATARITIEAGPIKDTYALAYVWDDDDAVRWEMAEKGTVVIAMHGSYLLAERDGVTDVTYELAVDYRIPMIGMLKRKAERVLIDVALKGLKRRVES